MGIAGTYRHNPKPNIDTAPGIQKQGVQRGCATFPLQNQLMPSGILACILLQPSRRDYLQGKETSLAERMSVPGEQALRRKIIHTEKSYKSYRNNSL